MAGMRNNSEGMIRVTYLEEIRQRQDKFCVEEIPDITKAVFRLELSNICNHACIFCGNSRMTRKKIQMEDHLAVRLIREAAEAGIKKAGFFINGEPFVSKRLADYIRFSKDLGMDYIFITTNGSLPDHKQLESILLGGGVNSIKFSINAGSRESYRKVHGRDDYEKVMDNLKYCHMFREKNNLKYRILTSFVVTPLTVHEMRDQYEAVKPYVDDIAFFGVSNWGGETVEQALQLKIDQKRYVEGMPFFSYKAEAPCSMLFNSVNVTCEGYLTLCCAEMENKMALMDLREIPLKEAWYSTEMQELRARHIRNELRGIQCYKCIHNVEADVEPLNRDLYLACRADADRPASTGNR